MKNNRTSSKVKRLFKTEENQINLAMQLITLSCMFSLMKHWAIA